MSLLLGACDSESVSPERFFHVNVQITGINSTDGAGLGHRNVEVPQEGASFVVDVTGEKAANNAYVSMIDFSYDEKSVYPYIFEPYDSEELKISYSEIEAHPRINIEVSANETTEERRIYLHLGDPYCSNRIIITQPGLSAEE